MSFRDRASATARSDSHAAYCLRVCDNGRTSDVHRDTISPHPIAGPIPGVGTLTVQARTYPGQDQDDLHSAFSGTRSPFVSVFVSARRVSGLQASASASNRNFNTEGLPWAFLPAGPGPQRHRSQARRCQTWGPHSQLRYRSRARSLRALPRPLEVFPAWSAIRARRMDFGIWGKLGETVDIRGCDTSSSGSHQFQASSPCSGWEKGKRIQEGTVQPTNSQFTSVCPVGRRPLCEPADWRGFAPSNHGTWRANFV